MGCCFTKDHHVLSRSDAHWIAEHPALTYTLWEYIRAHHTLLGPILGDPKNEKFSRKLAALLLLGFLAFGLGLAGLAAQTYEAELAKAEANGENIDTIVYALLVLKAIIMLVYKRFQRGIYEFVAKDKSRVPKWVRVFLGGPVLFLLFLVGCGLLYVVVRDLADGGSLGEGIEAYVRQVIAWVGAPPLTAFVLEAFIVLPARWRYVRRQGRKRGLLDSHGKLTFTEDELAAGGVKDKVAAKANTASGVGGNDANDGTQTLGEHVQEASEDLLETIGDIV